MNVRPSLVVTASLLLAAAQASAACPPGSRNCAKPLDLNLAPQISERIAADQPAALPAIRLAPVAGDTVEKPYTGPTVGVSTMVRRAPTVGYRWSLE